MVWQVFREEPYQVEPDERAFIPGSPARMEQVPWRRAAFFGVALLLCLTSNLVNALVSVNGSALMGVFDVDSDQIAWLPVAYSMTFVSMNLLVVRFRQQFGLRPYAMIGLIASSAVIGVHLLVRSFAGAIAVHAVAGIAAAPLGTLAVYYMMNALPKRYAINGVVLALGLEQVSTPVARLVFHGSAEYDLWRSLFLFEFGLTLICLGCVALFRLPPSEKSVSFQPLDIVTFLLVAPGEALLCAVLGLGTSVWWDTAWLGWALAAAIPLLGAAVLIESRRSRPLLDLGWLTGPQLLRFTLVAVVSRVVLTEQSSATGFLSLMGVGNNELLGFSTVLIVATVLGAVTAAVVFRPSRITEMVSLVLGLVAIAAFHDSYSSDLSRAPQFYITQGTIAFATAMFMGPALLFGVARVLQAGGTPLASFLVLFVATQNLGGLGGSALLNTFQTIREKSDSATLTGTVSTIDPATTARIAQFAGALNGTALNPAAKEAGGVAALQAEAKQESNILAYNNTFFLVAVIAAAMTAYLAAALAWRWGAGVLRGRGAPSS